MVELVTLVCLMDRQNPDGGSPPPDPCEIGALDFELDCQLIQMVTVGMT